MNNARISGMGMSTWLWACGVIFVGVTFVHAEPPPTTPTPASPPVLEPLLPPAAATDPDADPLGSATSSAQAEIIARIRKSLATPAPALDPAFAKHRLDQLAEDAELLERSSDSKPQRFHALSLLEQSLYNHLQRFPDDADYDRRLSHLRAAARRLRALDVPDGPAVGDFWLATSTLLEINRSIDLRPNERRYQARLLLKDYIERYPNATTTPAAKAALVALAPTTRPAPGTPGTPAADPEIGPLIKPAPAPTTPPLTPILPPTTPTDPTPTPDPATPAGANAAATTPAPTPPHNLDDITQPPFAIDDKSVDADNVVHYTLRSRYQPGVGSIRVLLPSKPATPPNRILYVLPVEPGDGHAFGDGFDEIRKLGLADKYNLIIVAPSFLKTPWYADNPKDPAIRQDSYFTKAIVPAIDQLYPIDKPRRLLLGFSKSGWGAFSLVLRYPDLFDAAAAWDAPLMQAAPNEFGMAPIFGSQENFDHYFLPAQIKSHANMLRRQKRFILLGYDHFRDHMQHFHDLLIQNEIPHDFIDGPQTRHAWNTGWIPTAIEKLNDLTK